MKKLIVLSQVLSVLLFCTGIQAFDKEKLDRMFKTKYVEIISNASEMGECRLYASSYNFSKTGATTYCELLSYSKRPANKYFIAPLDSTTYLISVLGNTFSDPTKRQKNMLMFSLPDSTCQVSNYKSNGIAHRYYLPTPFKVLFKNNREGRDRFRIVASHCWEDTQILLEKDGPGIVWVFYGKKDSSLDIGLFEFQERGDLPLPRIREKGKLGALPPKLTEYGIPSKLLTPYHATKVAWIPSMLVKDPHRSRQWQVQNSPYYTLERKVRFKTSNDWFIYNGTSVPQSRTWEYQSGWEVSEMNQLSISAGLSISVSATAGGEVSVEPFGLGGSANFSLTTGVTTSLGFESVTSMGRSHHKSKTETRPIVAPPRTSVVMWQGDEEWILRRTDGSIVKKWDRDGSSLYYTQYPPPARAIVQSEYFRSLQEDGVIIY